MKEVFDSLSYPALFAAVTGMVAFRYFLFAGAMHLCFRVLFPKAFAHRHIQTAFPGRPDVRRELLYSLVSIPIVGGVGFGMQVATRQGWTKIYNDVDQYGMGYAAISLVLLLVIHDAYFYWAHRLMHHPRLFRYLHNVHHESRNPSPWAAFAFQPTEAVLQAAFIPVAIVAFPVHSNVMLLFVFAMMWVNTLGHVGFEIYPAGFSRGRWTWWNNTSTHHNMHHVYVHCNYGLYFNWWDRLMGTNHPHYHEFFEAVTASPLLASNAEMAQRSDRTGADESRFTGPLADFRNPLRRAESEGIAS